MVSLVLVVGFALVIILVVAASLRRTNRAYAVRDSATRDGAGWVPLMSGDGGTDCGSSDGGGGCDGGGGGGGD